VIPPSPATTEYAESNDIVLLMPNVANWGFDGNNATAKCNAGTPVAGNCEEVRMSEWIFCRAGGGGGGGGVREEKMDEETNEIETE
jgi:hypothetical protein